MYPRCLETIDLDRLMPTYKTTKVKGFFAIKTVSRPIRNHISNWLSQSKFSMYWLRVNEFKRNHSCSTLVAQLWYLSIVDILQRGNININDFCFIVFYYSCYLNGCIHTVFSSWFLVKSYKSLNIFYMLETSCF